jgi:hypothetical protein
MLVGQELAAGRPVVGLVLKLLSVMEEEGGRGLVRRLLKRISRTFEQE